MSCSDCDCPPNSLSLEEKRAKYEIGPNNPLETWQNLYDPMVNLSSQFVNHEVEIADIEERLRDLWDEFIHAAIVIPIGSAEHDRLVTLVLNIREFGVLVRRKDSLNVDGRGDEAILPNGQRLWLDLPYFVEVIQTYWKKESFLLSASERENLAAWTAKLCAAGVFADELSTVALFLFKETFEVSKRSDNSDLGDNENIESISVKELLPACTTWMRFNNFKLVKLAANNHESHFWDEMSLAAGQGGSTAPGELARNAEIPTNGFSIARWIFWRQQLRNLHQSGDAEMAKLTKACFEAMVLTGLHVGVTVPGERKYLDNVFKVLDKELATREVKTSIGLGDITIDMGWAESDEDKD